MGRKRDCLYRALIFSKKTNMVFLDEKNQAYLFFDELKAKAFVAGHKDVKIGKIEKKSMKDIYTFCYKDGADKLLQIDEAHDIDNPIIEDLEKVDKVNIYLNNMLNKIFNQVIHHGDKQYLNSLIDCKFILPVVTTFGSKNIIKYPTQKLNKESEDKFFVVFTDLTQFNKWNEAKRNEFKSLEVDFEQLYRISGKKGCLVKKDKIHFVVTKETLRALYDKNKEKNNA